MDQAAIISEAIRKAGSQANLADATGLSQQFISKMLLGERGITAETAIKLEAATKIPRHAIRPDLWTPVEQARASRKTKGAA